MADDLIVKFFQEDLTEAEEAALSGRLLSSTEDALRFGQHAEAAYRYYGLPEPEWPGPSKGGARSFGPWKTWAWVTLAGLAGWGGWALWRHAVSTLPAPGVRAEAEVKTGEAPSAHRPFAPGPTGAKTAKTPALVRPVRPPERENPSPDIPGDLGNQTVGMAVTPVNLQARPHVPHTNLEVVVERHTPGQVTVQVLKPDGTCAVLLYQGPLAAGSWAFDWNGRLADGGPPVPGIYRIQVESGAVTLSKRVVIHPKPPK